MLKLLLICALSLMTLNACEKQKQASAEVGAIPEKLIDKVTSDISHATAVSEQRLGDIENSESSEGADK